MFPTWNLQQLRFAGKSIRQETWLQLVRMGKEMEDPPGDCFFSDFRNPRIW